MNGPLSLRDEAQRPADDTAALFSPVTLGAIVLGNPDLPDRLRRNLPLMPCRRDAFWGGTEHLYSGVPPY